MLQRSQGKALLKPAEMKCRGELKLENILLVFLAIRWSVSLLVDQQ